MSKKNKNKIKTKIIYKKVESVDESPKIKKEIEEIEQKKQLTGKGVRGFLRNLALNKQINDKRAYLKAKQKSLNIKEQTKMINEQVALEEAKQRLNQARNKSQVNFDGLLVNKSNQIKVEDIFK